MSLWKECLIRNAIRDFPGSPGVKTLPSNAGSVGLISGWGVKISHASRSPNQNIKQNQYYKAFNKDFLNGPHQKHIKKKKKYNHVLRQKALDFSCLESYIHKNLLSNLKIITVK